MIKNFTTTQRVKQTAKALLFSAAFLMSLMAVTPKVEAQVYTENFTVAAPYPQLVLPRGWSQGKYGFSVSSINQWDIVNNGTNPIAAPTSASTMLRFASNIIPNNEASFIASKRLDMRNNAAGAVFTFQFFRDNTGFWASNTDRIEVYVNDSAVVAPGNPSQLLLTETNLLANSIHRSTTLSPASAQGWQQYTYTIPNTYNTANVYVMIVAYSNAGGNMYVDDFSITQYGNPQALVFNSYGLSSQNTNTTAPSQVNQQVIGLKMTMDGTVNPRSLTYMTFNTNGCSNPPQDILNAKLYTTGGNPSWDLANALLIENFPSPWATNYAFLSATSYSALEHGDNYFWVTYDISGTAVSGNFVDAEWIEFRMNVTGGGAPAGITTAFTGTINPISLFGARQIDVVYCQPNYTVGTAWAGYFFNDYINGVRIDGDNGPGGGISPVGGNSVNPRNRIYGPAGSRCVGGTVTNPILCAYQRHPPDYENFPENGYAAVPSHAAVTNTTTTLTSFSGRVSSPTNPTGYLLTGYGTGGTGSVQLQVGDYFSANAIAAWIDYNGDGVFNNYFDNLRKVASTGTLNVLNISTASTLSSNSYGYGLNIGMNVYGPNVQPGTFIQGIAGNQVTLNQPLSGGVTNQFFEFVNTGTNGSPGNRGEKIAQSGPVAGWAVFDANFKVAEWSTNFAGKRRLRVREVWINYNIHPCNQYTYGETEDYTVTVRPDCPVFLGYKTWLGFTNVWTDPDNWCPAGAPIQGNTLWNLRFPGGPTGGSYTYTKALISSGVQALAQKMRVEVGDTVFIDAPAASNLTVTDSLIIQTPTSAIKINTSKVDTAQFSNGTLYPPTAQSGENLIPLRTTRKMRSQIIYDRTELLLKGMIDGDVIDTLRLHYVRRSPGAIYRNFKVKYFYTGPINSFSGIAVVPFNGLPNPAVQVYSGDVSITATAVNAGGTIVLVLSTPIVVTPVSSNRRLVLDISYDQSGFPLSGSGVAENEDMRFTQTQNQNWYLTWSSSSTDPAIPAAENLSPALAAPMANVVSALTVAIGIGNTTVTVASGAGYYPGQLITSPNAIRNLFITGVAGNVLTLSGPAISNQTATTNVTAVQHDYRTNSNLRPNITFSIRRPYIKYPISVAGHWMNNGAFIPAISRVTLNGGITAQRIEGTSITTFYDLNVNNPAHVTMFADVIVQDTLTLAAGRLKLNNRLLTLQKNGFDALIRTNGFIQADNDLIANNVAPFGRVRWMMDTTTTFRQLPFINAAGTYLPLSYKPQGGSHDVYFSTYRTNPDNTNIPSPTVTNIFGFNGAAWNADGTGLADRFYRVENATPTGAVADFTFRYEASNISPFGERASTNPSGASVMKAQRWLNDSTKWEEFPFFHPTQSYGLGAGHDTVKVEGFNMGSGPVGSWWVITGQATPLPVTLLDFVAEPLKDRVKLKWSTSSEINASHYIVERTIDNESFSFIGQVPANGTTTSRTDYNTWDLNPAQGIQYYYLRQYDRDGRMETYGPVSAKFTTELFDIVTATISSTEMGLTIVFNYDSNEPVGYKIIDVAGRIVAQKDRNPAEPGLNVIDIDTDLAKGVYQIILQNSEKQVSRKFFY